MFQAEQVLQNRYKLQRPLGQNALAEADQGEQESFRGFKSNRITWLAEDLSAIDPEQRQVVVKLLAFGGQVQWDDLKLFEREAQVLKTLHHQRIPQYRDFFSIDDRTLWFGLVQQYIPGASLKDLLAQGKKFTENQVRKIAVEVLQILMYLHELNPAVLHRDIKPSNLVLCEKKIYLVDFGAVQDRAAAEGATFTVVGTYGYAPMEQFGGRAVPSSDLYALGATLIHLLTGTAPADLPQRDLRIQFRDRASISSSLADWIEELTEPVLERRLSTARQALEHLKSGHALTHRRGTLDRPTDSKVQLHKSRKELSIEIPGPGLSFTGVITLALQGIGALIALIMILLSHSVVSMIVFAFIVGYAIKELKKSIGIYHLDFNREGFVSEWRLLGHRYRRESGETAEILDVFQSVINVTPESIFQSKSSEKEMVTIQTQSKRYSFGVGLPAVECLWLAHEIKNWLKLR
ncbi:MAG: serine/threonine-protein kinase [Leptolyngbyaceae bacterium]|nr:serine/threonine-protein kinase [Leptolyngbyaceae bacterium]